MWISSFSLYLSLSFPCIFSLSAVPRSGGGRGVQRDACVRRSSEKTESGEYSSAFHSHTIKHTLVIKSNLAAREAGIAKNVMCIYIAQRK